MSKASAYIDCPNKGQQPVPRGVLNLVKEDLDLQAKSKEISDRLKTLKEQFKTDLGTDIKMLYVKSEIRGTGFQGQLL